MSLKHLCAALMCAFSMSSANASPIAIDIDVPLGDYTDGQRIGPMGVSSDVNDLRVFNANSLFEERFICGPTISSLCGANLLFSFDTPISRLIFDVQQEGTLEDVFALVYSDPDAILGVDTPDLVVAWDGPGTVASTVSGSGPRQRFDVQSAVPFDRVFMNNSQNDFAAFGNFAFEPAAPIPLPAGLWLGLTGIAALSVMRMQQRAKG